MKRPDAESAHAAFLEAARLLREASAGTPVLELEWAVIQTLARDAAQMFDDLPLVLGPPKSVVLPRRWWQRHAGVELVDQKFLTVLIRVDNSGDEPMMEIVSILLGRDAVLRLDMTFVPATRARTTFQPGWMPPDDKRMNHLFYWNAGNTAEPILLNELEMEEADRILVAFERLAVLTRDRVAARLRRLRDREHL
jgi:hypothetical protein